MYLNNYNFFIGFEEGYFNYNNNYRLCVVIIFYIIFIIFISYMIIFVFFIVVILYVILGKEAVVYGVNESEVIYIIVSI